MSAHPQVYATKGLDMQEFVRRAADTHARLLETADHLAAVIDDAKAMMPASGVLGVVLQCRGCGEQYLERRRPDATEYGCCSSRCYRGADS